MVDSIPKCIDFRPADCSISAFAPLSMNHSVPEPSAEQITLSGFQRLIREMYFEKDLARGVDGTFMWLMEEIGELAGALRKGEKDELALEFADVLAWLATIANVAGIDLSAAVAKKYGKGCPGCGQFICTCDDAGKP
jgi:NTP pyrophosphatase (non-canonical NTP hydrolase)